MLTVGVLAGPNLLGAAISATNPDSAQQAARREQTRDRRAERPTTRSSLHGEVEQRTVRLLLSRSSAMTIDPDMGMELVGCDAHFDAWLDPDDPRLAGSALSERLCSRASLGVLSREVGATAGPRVQVRTHRLAESGIDVAVSVLLIIGPEQLTLEIGIVEARRWAMRAAGLPPPVHSLSSVDENSCATRPSAEMIIGCQVRTDCVLPS